VPVLPLLVLAHQGKAVLHCVPALSGAPPPQLLRIARPREQLLRIARPHEQLLRIARPREQMLRIARPREQLLRISRPRERSVASSAAPHAACAAAGSTACAWVLQVLYGHIDARRMQGTRVYREPFGHIDACRVQGTRVYRDPFGEHMLSSAFEQHNKLVQSLQRESLPRLEGPLWWMAEDVGGHVLHATLTDPGAPSVRAHLHD
jgi:hypothetical protein